jgi:hypothetical protein
MNGSTCDPDSVQPGYRKALGMELAALWPLLCDIFSGRPGCTGQAILESGHSTLISSDESEQNEIQHEDGPSDSSGESDTASVARSKAKNQAKKAPNSNWHPVDPTPSGLDECHS